VLFHAECDAFGAATGEVLYHAECDAFGAATEYGAGYGDTLKYTAREFDANTGLQYNRARWYDNSVGRWLSEDPIVFAAGDHNLYRYVSNFATEATDPSGLQAWRLSPPPGMFPSNHPAQKNPTAPSEMSEKVAITRLMKLRDSWIAEGTKLAANLLDWFVNDNGGKRGDSYVAKKSDIDEIKEHGIDLFKAFASHYVIPKIKKEKLKAGDKFEISDNNTAGGYIKARWLQPTLLGYAQTIWPEPVRMSNLNMFRAFGGVGVKMSGEISGREAGAIEGAFFVGVWESVTLKNIKITLFDNYTWDSSLFATIDPNYYLLYTLEQTLRVRRSFEWTVDLTIDEMTVTKQIVN
jgi:RHS repeat-associated protein